VLDGSRYLVKCFAARTFYFNVVKWGAGK